MITRLVLVALMLLSAGIVVHSNSRANSRAQPSSLVVVATHSIVGDIVQNVARDRVQLGTLVGPNSDVHDYQPVPEDLRNLGRATIVFENGFGLEPWLERTYTSSGSQASRIPVTANVMPLLVTEGPEAGEPDPHFWFNVTHVMSAVEVVRDSLSHVDPANADAYRANANEYVRELRELDSWIRDQVSVLPAERRVLFTSHDNLGYFARRYGFRIGGSALASISTVAEPSARQITALVTEIRNTGVPAIFPESVSNPALMDRIASEAGVRLGPTLYTDALGDPNSEGSTYIKLMRYNVSTIMSLINQ
jgi:ABC-type Zn uptake system ZnuABC Zn-binding protein ZnuA